VRLSSRKTQSYYEREQRNKSLDRSPEVERVKQVIRQGEDASMPLTDPERGGHGGSLVRVARNSDSAGKSAAMRYRKSRSRSRSTDSEKTLSRSRSSKRTHSRSGSQDSQSHQRRSHSPSRTPSLHKLRPQESPLVPKLSRAVTEPEAGVQAHGSRNRLEQFEPPDAVTPPMERLPLSPVVKGSALTGAAEESSASRVPKSSGVLSLPSNDEVMSTNTSGRKREIVASDSESFTDSDDEHIASRFQAAHSSAHAAAPSAPLPVPPRASAPVSVLAPVSVSASTYAPVPVLAPAPAPVWPTVPEPTASPVPVRVSVSVPESVQQRSSDPARYDYHRELPVCNYRDLNSGKRVIKATAKLNLLRLP
jgi:hypothetical protein